MSFASVYPHYVAKAEKNGRTKTEVDEIVRWLTGYSQKELDARLEKRTDFETFFAEAPDVPFKVDSPLLYIFLWKPQGRERDFQLGYPALIVDLHRTFPNHIEIKSFIIIGTGR